MTDFEALFKLSYGMCIVCSKEGDEVDGCLVNTVFQIVPEPPMVAVSINRQCLTHEYITSSRVFSVSVLSEETPMDFMGKFGFRSGREMNKFEEVNCRTGQTGAPIIMDNTAAFLEAEVTESIDIVTHTLFIAKIVACEILNDRTPMAYGYYRDVKHGRTPKSAATYHEVKPNK